MSASVSCVNCQSLGECSTVTEEKLVTGYYCGDWREAPQAKVVARQQILYKFGSAGSRVLLNKPLEPDVKEGE